MSISATTGYPVFDSGGTCSPARNGVMQLSEAPSFETYSFQQLEHEARSGNTAAMFELARRHQQGIGIPVNLDIAEAWLGEAVRLGDDDALMTLAILLRNKGDESSVASANLLLAGAAERRYPPAMLTLAAHHYLGIGIPRDPVSGVALAIEASLEGYEAEHSPVDAMIESLDEDQTAEVLEKVKWTKLWISFGPPIEPHQLKSFEEFQSAPHGEAVNTEWFQYEVEALRDLFSTEGSVLDLLFGTKIRAQEWRAAITVVHKTVVVSAQFSLRNLLGENGFPMIRPPKRDLVEGLRTTLAAICGRQWVDVLYLE